MDFEIPDDWRYMRVKDELDRGRLWKARDRLLGKLADEPANHDLLGLMGDVYFAMGDLPQAGRYWWLTDRDDERANAAAAAFYERFGTHEIDVLRALPRPTIADAYPPAVRARYEALVDAVREGGLEWKPPRRHAPAAHADLHPDGQRYRPTWRDRLISPEFLGFVLVLILVLAVFGLVTMVGGVIGILT
jgi:hypothetical protein